MPEDIIPILKDKFPDINLDAQTQCVIVDASQLKELCLFLKENFGFEYLANLTAIDYKDKLGLVYIFYSFKSKNKVSLKVFLERNNPSIESIADIFCAANWHEREAYDLMGVNFTGHPDLRRILLPDDWQGYPLRKDYALAGMLKIPQ